MWGYVWGPVMFLKEVKNLWISSIYKSGRPAMYNVGSLLMYKCGRLLMYKGGRPFLYKG